MDKQTGQESAAFPSSQPDKHKHKAQADLTVEPQHAAEAVLRKAAVLQNRAQRIAGGFVWQVKQARAWMG